MCQKQRNNLLLGIIFGLTYQQVVNSLSNIGPETLTEGNLLIIT